MDLKVSMSSVEQISIVKEFHSSGALKLNNLVPNVFTLGSWHFKNKRYD